ncbi:MAG: IucA/IucC family C-terminal-domain containing protein, partial [Thiohalorhabdaceae bacterium]
IKPSTLTDGAKVQVLLGRLAAEIPGVGERLLLTEEAQGAHVASQSFLGFMQRSYPAGLDGDTSMASVAALAAPAPNGRIVFAELARAYYQGDARALFTDYLTLTLRLHLTLWIRYGVALESNQQNSTVVLSRGTPQLRLLLKDNDAPRIDTEHLVQRRPDLAGLVQGLQDPRIRVTDPLPLAQMVVTITLQLNIGAIVEALAEV